ncbi:amino acid aminotransferase [Rhodovulum adriaticum]|uniref:Aminotransferase n=1 Tax=Rhodovulum adriaticum TaxID=35804 RepID=A0A4R2NJ14_RHOAD|nr:amino acid aminotransferase [Rhodovulum adriaticum]MBK1635895.1 aromatic amino acid aminotransferase [Rhodovulum adriaticum]TCP21437.1 aromatic amino acid aminotransferase [Rhodovulum adriaticum]
MLAGLSSQTPDKIMALMRAYAADPRTDKIDLGVGVFRDPAGRTPVMAAVKTAEERLWRNQDTKTYVALEGDPAYLAALSGLVLGDAVPADRRAAIATPGGTGAVRMGLELARLANPSARIFVPDPSWPNHAAIIGFLGLERVDYRYYDAQARGLNIEGMLADLGRAGPGDVVLLHGCCHNPTGADLSAQDWQAVAGLLTETGAMAMVDIAYQGFGAGLEADAEGLRILAGQVPELLVATSCSKNFGIYRERAGALFALAPDGPTRDLAQSNLTMLNRQTYAFPPDHGARVVTEILTDPDLRADWQAELEGMRLHMQRQRQGLADTLRDLGGSDRFAHLGAQRGMFSLLGATPDQVERMRAEHGVYMIGDSRINVAGLSPDLIPRVAQAMLAVGL